MGEYLKEHLCNSTLHVVEGQGLLLVISRWCHLLASAIGADEVAKEPPL